MLDDNDAALVARVVAAQDNAAFEVLVQRHQGRIRRWLRHLTHGDAARADELAQDTFVSAWLNIRSFSGKGSFRSWLMRIAYNGFLQSLRKSARDKRLADSVATQRVEESLASHDAMAVADLPKLLAVLGDEERAAIVLCYAFGYSHAEIAEITALPLGTVKSHIRRGCQRIEREFGVNG